MNEYEYLSADKFLLFLSYNVVILFHFLSVDVVDIDLMLTHLREKGSKRSMPRGGCRSGSLSIPSHYYSEEQLQSKGGLRAITSRNASTEGPYIVSGGLHSLQNSTIHDQVTGLRYVDN